MGYNGAERDWLELVAILNRWGSATVLAPGRIELIADGANGEPRTVEIILSAEDWETMWTVAFGDLNEGAAAIRFSFTQLKTEDRYLVYNGQYEVVPSPDENVPTAPEELKFRRYVKDHPPGPGSDYGWFASPPTP